MNTFIRILSKLTPIASIPAEGEQEDSKKKNFLMGMIKSFNRQLPLMVFTYILKKIVLNETLQIFINKKKCVNGLFFNRF